MTYEEFDRYLYGVSSLGRLFTAHYGDNEVFVLMNNNVIAKISTVDIGGIKTDCPYFLILHSFIKRELLEVFCELSLTPLKERENCSQYIIPLPNLCTETGEQQYLTQGNNKWYVTTRNYNLKQTWNEEELVVVPKCYKEFAVTIKEHQTKPNEMKGQQT